MPEFAYRARSAGEAAVQGVIEADSTAGAVQKLNRMGYFALSVERRDAADAAAAAQLTHQAVPATHLSASLRQMSDLLEAGLPLTSVLTMTADQATHPRLRHLLNGMARGVQEGKTLSRLMGETPDVFPPFYSHLVFAGETGGMLGTVLSRLADHAEKEAELRAQTKAALAYPAFIVLVGVLTIFFLLGVIIPRLATLFADFQQRLPLPTRILLAMSALLRHWGWLALPLGFGLWALRRKAAPRPEWLLRRDRLVLKLPGVRRWVANQEIAQFARTLGSLLENGVPILQALQITAQTLGNAVFSRAVEGLQAPVRDGRTLSQGLRDIPLFPAYVCNLVAVGEEGGKLDQSLLKIAATYDRQAQRDMKVVVSLLEPVLILSIGLVLGAVVVSIMLPIFEINTLIH